MRKKILIVAGSLDDKKLMEMFDMDFAHDQYDDNIGLVLFTGGEDVTPELYGHKNLDSFNNPQRDDHEAKIFGKFIDVPKVGICRGSQFLNVMSGGTMVQDLQGHGLGAHRYHEIKTNDGRMFSVNSTHHQMSIPGDKSELIAWSDEQLSNVYLWKDGIYKNDVINSENEVIFHPHTKSLGFQYHPEWMPKEMIAVKYFKEQIQKRLGV